MIDQEIVKITPEELDALMPEGDQVHTYIQAGFTLIGGDWERASILKKAKEYGAELAGEHAAAMGHGAAFYRKDGSPVFVATKPTEGEKNE